MNAVVTQVSCVDIVQVSTPGPQGPQGAPGLNGPVLVSVSATLPSSANNYAPSGYIGGSTNRLLLTPFGGGSTLTGLSSSMVTDNWEVFIYNQSATDVIDFLHLSASSTAANRFSCPQGQTAQLASLTGVLLRYITSVGWVFA